MKHSIFASLLKYISSREIIQFHTNKQVAQGYIDEVTHLYGRNFGSFGNNN